MRWTTFFADAPRHRRRRRARTMRRASRCSSRALALDPALGRGAEPGWRHRCSPARSMRWRRLPRPTSPAPKGSSSKPWRRRRRSALAHNAKGHVLRAQGRPEEAIPEYETVIALESQLGGGDQPSRLVQVLDRVDRGGDRIAAAGHPPQPARSLHRHLVLPDRARASAAVAHRRGDRLVRKGARRQSGITRPHGCLAAAYGLKGWTERAAAELAEAQRLSDGRYASIARLKAAGHWGVPEIAALFETTYFAGLRQAGMPEVERRAPLHRKNGLISAATWLTWPQLGAGDEVWDFLRAAIAAALGAG